MKILLVQTNKHTGTSQQKWSVYYYYFVQLTVNTNVVNTTLFCKQVPRLAATLILYSAAISDHLIDYVVFFRLMIHTIAVVPRVPCSFCQCALLPPFAGHPFAHSSSCAIRYGSLCFGVVHQGVRFLDIPTL